MGCMEVIYDPKGPRTQIMGFQSRSILLPERYLGPKARIFGSLNRYSNGTRIVEIKLLVGCWFMVSGQVTLKYH